MSPNRTKSQRCNFYIDKDFQTKFILKFCGLVSVGSLLTVAAIYWMAMHSTTVGIDNGHVAVHTTAEYLLPLLLQTVFIELAVVCLAAMLMMLFVSHQIAGPLYHLKLMLVKLGEGDFSSDMRLREGDQLKMVATAYNTAVEKINGKIKAIKEASSLDEVKNTLNNFKI